MQAVEHQDQGEYTRAFLEFNDIMNMLERYRLPSLNGGEGTSALANAAGNIHQIANVVQAQVATLFEQATLSGFINRDVCVTLPELQENGLLSDPDVNLPKFYIICGEVFLEADQQIASVEMYRRLLNEFPNYPLSPDVKRAAISAIIADAARRETIRLISQPTTVGSRARETAVFIQNGSSQEIRVALSGSDSYLETLESCDNCLQPNGSGCPDDAPLSTYILPSGTYDVLVETLDTDEIQPFTGRWTLQARQEYYLCFVAE
ncbi:hypothetical protein KFU94_03650 [Chloroflexi bacterium TSY]|nr:hypothetical protein [Chloroflexi bacterium TSY]